jgi:hypothetical protein
MTDLAALSARALAKAIRDKKVSSVEATKAAIDRLQACHELTNCIVALDRRRLDLEIVVEEGAYPDVGRELIFGEADLAAPEIGWRADAAVGADVNP